MMRSEIISIIYESMDELKSQYPSGPDLAKDPDEVLYGNGGKLDSLGLVNLIVIVTERIQDRFGAALILVDEKAFSQNRSPFRSVASLAEHIGSLLQVPDVR